MTKKTIEELRDFALFTFKTYQDVINVALERSDVDTVRSVAKSFDKSISEHFEDRNEMRADGLRWHLENLQPGDERAEIEKALKLEESRVAAAKELRLARQQIFFGLAGRALQVFLRDQGKSKLDAVNVLLGYLPQEFPKLLRIVVSVTDSGVSDRWGWHWWDFQPDGEVRGVDTTSLPYRIFVVRALQSLALQNPGPVVEGQVDEGLIYLFEDNQVPAILTEVEQHWDRYANILGDEERPRVAQLRALMEQIRQAGHTAREARLVAAPIDDEKLQEFKENVARSFEEGSKLRAIVAHFGGYSDKTGAAAPDHVQSWGYNQIDDKAAFIKDWHVHYGSWGDTYGRGLAQAETNRAFELMANGAAVQRTVFRNDLIPEVKRQIESRKWTKPIILQTLRHTLEYEQIRNREDFVSRYRTDFAFPPEAELDGFIGVLKVGNDHISVFDIFVQSAATKDRLLLVELPKILEWDRYSPLDDDNSATDVFEQLRIKVIDLNQDNQRRQKLLADNPAWLNDKGDQAEKETFLRKHVVVNVYDKFDLRILEPKAAVCITVDATHERDGKQPNSA